MAHHTMVKMVLVGLVSLLASPFGYLEAQSPSSDSDLVLPEPAPSNLVETLPIVTFDEGSFLESIATHEGLLYVTVLNSMTDSGQIWRLNPFDVTYWSGVEKELFAEVRGSNLAFHPDGTLYATVISGSFADPTTLGFRLSRFSPDGQETVILEFPVGSAPNGMSFDAEGTLYIADSQLGRIWKVLDGTSELQSWLEAESLSPQGALGIPGINGLEVWNGFVYTVNSSTGEFMRIPLDAPSPAAVEVVATGIPGDGFVLDQEGNAYITTNPFNSVIKLTPDGSREVIATPENQIIGATDIVLGTGEYSQSVYLVQGGGIVNRLLPPPTIALFPPTTRQDFGPPAVMRLDYPNRLNCALLPPIQANALLNGDFEAGETGWQIDYTVTPSLQRSGRDTKSVITTAAVLGGQEGSRDAIEQTLTIPDNAVLIYGWEIVNSRTRSRLYVSLIPTDGTPAVNLFTHRNETAPLGPQQTCLDLSAYAGKEVALAFQNVNDNYTMTFFVVDDVVVASLAE